MASELSSVPMYGRKTVLIPKKDINIGKVIGEGGQAVVYHAEWKGMHVVFKKLRNTRPSVRKEFVQELSSWTDAVHPSCVAMYGIVDEDETFGFVAEYCALGSLYLYSSFPYTLLLLSMMLLRDIKFKEDGVVLSGGQSVDIAFSIASALNTMHAKRIAHRDIKCANIMLDGSFNAKLGDFGISQTLTTQLRTAFGSGTFTHVAPEEILHQGGKIDPVASDVYSFGVLLRELALCKVATTRDTSSIPNFPLGLSKTERQAWWSLVSACTQEKTKKRPTMEQILNKIGAIRASIKGFKCKKHTISVKSITRMFSHKLPHEKQRETTNRRF